jgi:phosphatidylglycerol:prolipoprotein diacylglycerol transferase
MHPVCLTIGDRVIYWYGILMALAFLAGILTWWRLGWREGRDAAWASDLAFWAMLAGIVGARIAYIVSDWSYFWAHPLQILRVDRGGLIFYGGFLGTILMVLFLARMRKESALGLGDLMVTALPLGHMLGRIGCFFNGCCFGKPLPGALGIQFPADSPAWWEHTEAGLITSEARWSLPVHAVQLYEAALNFILFFVLVYCYPRRKRTGDIVALYLMIYPPIRFFLEFLRGDQRAQWGQLTVAQDLSLVFFLAGLILWVARRPPVAKANSSPKNNAYTPLNC